jgi:hypothetical protein
MEHSCPICNQSFENRSMLENHGVEEHASTIKMVRELAKKMVENIVDPNLS